MKVRFICVAILSLLLAACGDGVPRVDPEDIVIDGQLVKPDDFIQKYCAGKTQNETCMKVLVVARRSSTRGGARLQW